MQCTNSESRYGKRFHRWINGEIDSKMVNGIGINVAPVFESSGINSYEKLLMDTTNTFKTVPGIFDPSLNCHFDRVLW